MERNRNVDIIRAFAILAVVIYHIFCITNIAIPNEFLQSILGYAGEFGVTIFFILSGYSIYSSIKHKGDKFKYYEFVCKRMKRILPQYYICLMILLLFTNMAVYLNYGNIGNLFAHIFMFHDHYPTWQGAISGVCWTLGVIFQFYLISPLLFKMIEKKPKLTLCSSIIFSVLIKFFIYHLVLSKAINVVVPEHYYFGLGRTIFTALDSFVMGMFLGKIIKLPKDNKKVIINIIGLIISSITFILWLFVDRNRVNVLGVNTGLYSDCIEGYVFHCVLAICLSFMIYFFSNIKLPLENEIARLFLFISKYEYGIFIWHLLLINALCQNSQFIIDLVTTQRKITYIILLFLSIASGAFMTELIDNINYKEIYLKFKKPIKNTMLTVVGIFVCILVYRSIKLLPEIYNNFSYVLNNEITYSTPSKIIAENAEKVIPENAKYAYLDIEETGYLYYYELRYLLSPRESIHYNTYCIELNYSSIDEIYEKLNGLNVDFFIIKDAPILEKYFNCDYDNENGTVVRKNKSATSINDLFIKE